MMLVSFTLYTVRFIKELKNNKKDGSPKEVEAEDPEEGASLPNGK